MSKVYIEARTSEIPKKKQFSIWLAFRKTITNLFSLTNVFKGRLTQSSDTISVSMIPYLPNLKAH